MLKTLAPGRSRRRHSSSFVVGVVTVAVVVVSAVVLAVIISFVASLVASKTKLGEKMYFCFIWPSSHPSLKNNIIEM